jgi:hypothetical protein
MMNDTDIRDCARQRNDSAAPTRKKCTIVRPGGRLIRFNPTDPAAVRFIRQRIADDYRSRDGARINRVAKLRIADIEWVLRHRYGPVLPDDDAGREDLVILLNHVAQNRDDPHTKMIHTARVWAPWMAPTEAEELVNQIILARPRRYRATTLGRLLNLTKQEHELGNLQTIRPVGVTDADMKEKERDRERERKRSKRRSEGVVPREEYLAQAKSRTEPWMPLGISKSTYYRWLEAGKIPNETGPSAPLEDTYRADTPVSPGSDLILLPHDPRRAPEARARQAPDVIVVNELVKAELLPETKTVIPPKPDDGVVDLILIPKPPKARPSQFQRGWLYAQTLIERERLERSPR